MNLKLYEIIRLLEKFVNLIESIRSISAGLVAKLT